MDWCKPHTGEKKVQFSRDEVKDHVIKYVSPPLGGGAGSTESYTRTVFTGQKCLTQEEAFWSGESCDTGVGRCVQCKQYVPVTLNMCSSLAGDQNWCESLPYVIRHPLMPPILGMISPLSGEGFGGSLRGAPPGPGEYLTLLELAGGQNWWGGLGPHGFHYCCCHYFKAKEKRPERLKGNKSSASPEATGVVAVGTVGRGFTEAEEPRVPTRAQQNLQCDLGQSLLIVLKFKVKEF